MCKYSDEQGEEEGEEEEEEGEQSYQLGESKHRSSLIYWYQRGVSTVPWETVSLAASIREKVSLPRPLLPSIIRVITVSTVDFLLPITSE